MIIGSIQIGIAVEREKNGRRWNADVARVQVQPGENRSAVDVVDDELVGNIEGVITSSGGGRSPAELGNATGDGFVITAATAVFNVPGAPCVVFIWIKDGSLMIGLAGTRRL